MSQEKDEKIKKLEAQLAWYQEKLAEINQSYYQESKFLKLIRYLHYQLSFVGLRSLVAKLSNPKKLKMFFKAK